MYALKTILFPVDFYHDEVHTLRHIRSLVDPRAAEIILVHILDPRASDPRREKAEFDVDRWFGKLTEAGRAMGLTCHAEVQRGAPRDSIMRMASARNADCIAVPTGGRSAVDRLLESSLCMQLIHESDVPVMAVTPTMGSPRLQSAEETLPRTIVCIVNRLDTLDALHAALGIARPIHASVIAIHPGGKVSDELRDSVDRIFRQDEFKDLESTFSFTRNVATDDIVNAVHEVQAHLLVMSADLNVESEFPGSTNTAESVISLSECPVLTLPSVVHASR